MFAFAFVFVDHVFFPRCGFAIDNETGDGAVLLFETALSGMAKRPRESFLGVDEGLAFYYRLFLTLFFLLAQKKLAMLYSIKIPFFVILPSLREEVHQTGKHSFIL
jgi:hypothetical protein